jgi:hypothetical protein
VGAGRGGAADAKCLLRNDPTSSKIALVIEHPGATCKKKQKKAKKQVGVEMRCCYW